MSNQSKADALHVLAECEALLQALTDAANMHVDRTFNDDISTARKAAAQAVDSLAAESGVLGQALLADTVKSRLVAVLADQLVGALGDAREHTTNEMVNQLSATMHGIRLLRDRVRSSLFTKD